MYPLQPPVTDEPSRGPSHPTWSVAVTTKAPPVVVKAFVAHHILLGAHEIFLYFDDPDDPSFDIVRALPGVRAFRCDVTHWSRLYGKRPPGLVARQVVNVNHARAASKAAWLGNIDIDEFLHPRRSVGETLADVPASADVVRLGVAENVHRARPGTYADMYEGPFKKRLPADEDGELASVLLYGALGAQLTRGLQGHHLGKTFTRVSADVQIRVHNVLYRKKRILPPGTPASVRDPEQRVLPFAQDSTLLLHFFSMGHRDWCGKCLKHLDPRLKSHAGPAERARHRAFLDAAMASPRALDDLFVRLHVVSEAQQGMLRQLSLLVDVRLDLPAAVARVFGAGPHGFDDALPVMQPRELGRIFAEFAAAQQPRPA